jgi:hypothetical protein
VLVDDQTEVTQLLLRLAVELAPQQRAVLAVNDDALRFSRAGGLGGDQD